MTRDILEFLGEFSINQLYILKQFQYLRIQEAYLSQPFKF